MVVGEADSIGTWDYVIVGGGSAGCVLANRLSADGRTTVLVLEAGGEAKGLAMRVPALIQKMSSHVNWLYPVEPDPSRNGAVDAYSSGRVLGGGSSLNAMMWVRGNPRDYDGWEAQGCTGWRYENVLEYFRRTERFELGTSTHRGGDGPQHVAPMRVSHRMTDAFIEAARQTGFEQRADYNAAEQEGVGVAQVNQRRGLRHSAADAFLVPARKRPNLTVQTGAEASRIVLNGARAVGVAFRAGGRAKVARAAREVILAAGGIGSPKLLLLSGVGPGARLAEHGIPVVADLPGVGRNLQDHAAASVVYEVTERTLNQDVTPLRLMRHGLDFVFRRRGAITSTANHAVAFGRSNQSAAVPDVELIFVAFGLTVASEDPAHDVKGALGRLTARSGGRSEGRRKVATDPLVTTTAVVLHPRIRGEVSLRSADSKDAPRIRHDLLGHPADVDALTQALLKAREIFDAPAFAPYVVSERLPGDAVQSREDLQTYLQQTTFRLYHVTSTCRMGTDRMSVVDPRLRVRGIQSLRVIDASVMPEITSGNTNAPTMMIAEKGSDLVLEDAR